VMVVSSRRLPGALIVSGRGQLPLTPSADGRRVEPFQHRHD